MISEPTNASNIDIIEQFTSNVLILSYNMYSTSKLYRWNVKDNLHRWTFYKQRLDTSLQYVFNLKALQVECTKIIYTIYTILNGVI